MSITNNTFVSAVLWIALGGAPVITKAHILGSGESPIIGEAHIAEGMTQDQVEQALGEPIDKQGYINRFGGITWVYEFREPSSASNDYVYEVDFSMDRKVVFFGRRALFIY